MNQVIDFVKKNAKMLQVCAGIFMLVCYLFPFYTISIWGVSASASGLDMMFSDFNFFRFLLLFVAFVAVALLVVCKFVKVPVVSELLENKMIKVAVAGGSALFVLIGSLIGMAFGGIGVGAILFIIAALVNGAAAFVEE